MKDRREANRAVAVSAIGLAATGVIELLLAIVTGSVGLRGDAIHNLSDVCTSAVVFLGFRLSRRLPTERYPYAMGRLVADSLSRQLPKAGNFTWITRAAPRLTAPRAGRTSWYAPAPRPGQ